MSASLPGSGTEPTLPRAVAAGLGAIGRVAGALVSASTLQDLAERGLAEMRDALDLEVASLYLPDGHGRPRLRLHVTAARGDAVVQAAHEVVFDDEAWRLAVVGGAPLVFHEEGDWLVDNPFQPPATFWLVLPLYSDRAVVGVVLGASRDRIALGPTGAGVLALIGDLLTAGITTARLRQALFETELERERAHLAALVHEGLAQDLALASRELALLDAAPSPQVAASSFERLRAAVTSAHTIVRDRLKDLVATAPLGGVGDAVGDICDQFVRRGLVVRLRQRPPHARVGAATHAAVVRVLSEALANVEKHAGARAVDVSLTAEDARLTLVVSDDGSGFEVSAAAGPDSGRFGITLMHDRARAAGGTIALCSEPGAGTVIRLQLPTS